MTQMTAIEMGEAIAPPEDLSAALLPPKRRALADRWFGDLPATKRIRLVLGGTALAALLGGAIAFIGIAIAREGAQAGHFPTIAQWIVAVMTCLGVPLLLHLAYRLTSELAEPLQTLNHEMQRLAAGELDINIPYRERGDEIGDIARTMEVFLRASHQINRLRQRQEEARVERETVRADHDRQLAAFAARFEDEVARIANGVAAAASQLQSTAVELAASADQTTSQTEAVSQAMVQASGGVAAAAAASDEFALSIAEISRQAAQSAELARTATVTAEQTDGTISDLAVSADQVGAVVELIRAIAQRTSLLALNASIEAARGGDAGRGFAVVASEVKDLASRTRAATDDVAAQIRAMQESTGASVTALRAIAGQVRQLEATAVSIASAVDQQSVAGQELARNIDTAARGAGEVGTTIHHVRDTARATGDAAAQLLGSASELQSQAATLRSQVDGFMRQMRPA